MTEVSAVFEETDLQNKTIRDGSIVGAVVVSSEVEPITLNNLVVLRLKLEQDSDDPAWLRVLERHDATVRKLTRYIMQSPAFPTGLPPSIAAIEAILKFFGMVMGTSPPIPGEEAPHRSAHIRTDRMVTAMRYESEEQAEGIEECAYWRMRALRAEDRANKFEASLHAALGMPEESK